MIRLTTSIFLFSAFSIMCSAQFTLDIRKHSKLKLDRVRKLDPYLLEITVNGKQKILQARKTNKYSTDLIDKTNVFKVYEINKWYGLLVDTTSEYENRFKSWVFSFNEDWFEYQPKLELINDDWQHPSPGRDYIFFNKSANRINDKTIYDRGSTLLQLGDIDVFEQIQEEYISWKAVKDFEQKNDSVFFWNNSSNTLERTIVVSKQKATTYSKIVNKVANIGFPSAWEHYRLSPDGKYLALQFPNSKVEVYDTEGGKAIANIPDVFYRCGFDFDLYFESKKIRVVSPDNVVRTLDLSIAQTSFAQKGPFFKDLDYPIETRFNRISYCSKIIFLNEGKWFTTITGNSFTLWETKTRKIIREYHIDEEEEIHEIRLLTTNQHIEVLIGDRNYPEKIYFEAKSGKEIKRDDFLNLTQITAEKYQLDDSYESMDSVRVKDVNNDKILNIPWDKKNWNNGGIRVSKHLLHSTDNDTLRVFDLIKGVMHRSVLAGTNGTYWKHQGGAFFTGKTDEFTQLFNNKTSAVLATLVNDSIARYKVNHYHEPSNSLLVTKTVYLGVDSTSFEKDKNTGEIYYPRYKNLSIIYQYFETGTVKELFRINSDLEDCSLSPDQRELILIAEGIVFGGIVFASQNGKSFLVTDQLKFGSRLLNKINNSSLLRSFNQVPTYNYCGGLFAERGKRGKYDNLVISNDRNNVALLDFDDLIALDKKTQLCNARFSDLFVIVSRKLKFFACHGYYDFQLFRKNESPPFDYSQVEFTDILRPARYQYNSAFSFNEGHFFFQNQNGGLFDFHSRGVKRLFLDSYSPISTDTLDRTGFFTKGDDTYVLVDLEKSEAVYSGKEEQKGLLKAYLVDSVNWVVVHASGLFDGPQESLSAIHFVKGMDVFPLEALKTRYYEPNLAHKLLRGEEPRSVKGLNTIELPPDIETMPVDKKGYLPVKVKNRGSGIGPVPIFINGREVVEDARPKDVNPNAAELSFKVYLGNQKSLLKVTDNFILVKAWNKDESVVNRGTLIKYNSGSNEVVNYQPAIHILSCGVSDYTGTELDLKYAAKDAEDVSKSIQLGAKQLFGSERSYVYTLTTERTKESYPTKANILKAFEKISSTAHPMDVLVMYISGHGINHGGHDGDWHYLTQDAYTGNASAYNDAAIRKQTTISSNELVDLFKKIPALKQVLMIDACASGRVVENLMAQKDVSSSTLRALDRMRDRTGMHIITGCTADAVSYEASKYGQGVLTYSLLEGIRGAALREDKFIDVNKLFQYAHDRVPTLARGIGGIQTPQIYSPQGAQSFDLGLLTENEKKEIPIAKIRPVYIRSSFQDEKELEDVLGLGKAIDEAMSETSLKEVDAKLIFIDVKDYPDGCKLIGRYQKEGGKILLKLRKKCGDGATDFEIKADNIEKIKEEILKII
jgi:hypothetical protein